MSVDLQCVGCGSTFTLPKMRRGQRFCSHRCYAASLAVPAVDRYWAAVIKGDGCWGWRLSVVPKGYPQLNVNRRPRTAHRFAWEVHNGRSVPEGMCVLHRCDNPVCTRPDHLFLGTIGDNNRDMFAKGRNGHGAPRGEKSPQAKITAADVIEIRRAYEAARGPSNYVKRGTVAGLVARYGIGRSELFRIVKREVWAHV